MRHIYFFGSVILATGAFVLLLFGFSAVCCNERPIEFKHKPADSVLTTVSYAFNAMTNDYRTTTARKIVIDTCAYTVVDSLTSVKKWRRDSVYFIPFKDSVRVKNKDSIFLRWAPCPKDLILVDYNKNWK